MREDESEASYYVPGQPGCDFPSTGNKARGAPWGVCWEGLMWSWKDLCWTLCGQVTGSVGKEAREDQGWCPGYGRATLQREESKL